MPLLLHLVGSSYYYISDARLHKHQIYRQHNTLLYGTETSPVPLHKQDQYYTVEACYLSKIILI